MSSNSKPNKKQHTLKGGCEKKLLSLLGFAARARKIVAGTDLCRDEVRRGKLPLVIVAADASANTFKRIFDACNYYDTDICKVPISSADLSKQIGKLSNIAVIGVNDMNFVDGITALFEENDTDNTAPKGRLI